MGRENGDCRNTDDTIRFIESVTVEAAGNKPKQIIEYIGRLASGDPSLSIARMQSPEGWMEPAQTPEFDETTLVLRGEVHLTANGRTEVVRAGQAVRVPRGIRVQYATPAPEGADYIAVCVPAYAPDIVHRE